MTRAHLGLGGNLGEPALFLARALRMLDERADTRIVRVSRLYRTPPWGLLDQPPFLNACAAVDTQRGAAELLNVCLGIERALKRERRERWGPRTIDIDVLDWGGIAVQTDVLTLPHPRMTERGFVLVPLAEIASSLAVRGRPIAHWLGEADAGGIEPASEDDAWWRAESPP